MKEIEIGMINFQQQPNQELPQILKPDMNQSCLVIG